VSETQFLLGKLVSGSPERDAVHIAVVAVEAATVLSAGMRIGFDASGKVARVVPEIIGVVDPFLTETVYPGDKCWMFLLPNTITSLKHNWTHPAFEDKPNLPSQSESERWLRSFAAEVDADYDEMMRVAASHCDEGNRWGDYLIDGGKWEGQSTPDEFWTHYAAVTGKTPSRGPTGIFSCSC
jgi:hypothetical protein